MNQQIPLNPQDEPLAVNDWVIARATAKKGKVIQVESFGFKVFFGFGDVHWLGRAALTKVAADGR